VRGLSTDGGAGWQVCTSAAHLASVVGAGPDRSRHGRAEGIALGMPKGRTPGRDAAGAVAVAAPDPHAAAGRLQRHEDEAELRAAVRAAVAGLPAAQRRAVELLYGIGRDCGS